MRIVVATPLYPPEIAEPAPYVKELAKRLRGRHEVTIVTYGRLPEKVEGVVIISIDKLKPLPARLSAYFFALWRAAKSADVLYIQNGPSVELPAALVTRLTGTPFVVHIADTAAHAYAAKHVGRRLLERLAFAPARSLITDTPLAKPEINPLLPTPERELAAHEESWQKHLALLERAFNHA